MIHLGLPLAHARSGRWWPENAVYAADFINNRYMRNGAEIDRASAFSFSRSTPKLAEDSKGVWHHFGIDEPAITDRGLLLEPAATNMVPNPTMAGAVRGVVGAGGALPTGWTTTNFSPVEVLDTGWEDGLPYITLRLRYTNSTGAVQYPCLIPAMGVPANLGEQWTASAFYKLLAGTWHPNPAAFLNVKESGTTQTYPNTVRPGDMKTRTRLALTWSISRAGMVTMEMRSIMFNASAGDAIDLTVQICAPMLSREALASSVTLVTARATDSMLLDLPDSASQLSVISTSGTTTVSATPGQTALPLSPTATIRRVYASSPELG